MFMCWRLELFIYYVSHASIGSPFSLFCHQQRAPSSVSVRAQPQTLFLFLSESFSSEGSFMAQTIWGVVFASGLLAFMDGANL